MPRRDVVRRPRKLAAAVALLLAVPLALQTAAPAFADPVATTVAVTGPDTATVGEPTVLEAVVTPHGVTGTVSFFTTDGPLGDAEVDEVTGVASLPHTFTSAGPVTVQAAFVPDDSTGVESSSDLTGRTFDVEAVATPTTTTVTGPATAVAGVATELTAEVSPPEAAGTVQFTVDGDPVGQPVAIGGDGDVELLYTFTLPGTWSVGAEFTPLNPEVWEASADLADVDVSEPAPTTTTTLVTGPSAATAGTATSLTASVSPSGAAGTVQFSIDGSPVGSPVAVTAGTATLPHTFAAAGTPRVRASFTPTDSEAFTESADTTGLLVTVSAETTTPPAPVATSTVVSAPGSVSVGSPTTLTASVSPTTAAGTVQFSVDGVPVGAAVPVAAGAASTSHTFSAGGDHVVTASFTPTDPSAYLASADPTGRTVAVSLIETSTEVTAPTDATTGEESTLAAAVLPADAAGTVTFSVAGEPVAAAAVEAGVASAPYTFADAGTVTVTATFQPTDADRYATSTGDAEVEVAAGTTATEGDDGIGEDESTTYGSTCNPGRPGLAPRRDPYGALVNPYVVFRFQALDALHLPVVPTPLWYGSFLGRFHDLNFQLYALGLGIRVGPCGTIIRGPGQQPGARPLGQVTELTVPCTPTGDGFRCALPDLDAGTEIAVTAPFALPAVAAGRTIGVTSTIDGTDAATGETRTIGSEEHVIEVPKRTVLSARLAPKRHLTKVSPGARVPYRLTVRNAGVVKATDVRACVTVAQGAGVVARGADVHGRRACWTLPSLKKADSVRTSFTVVAPRHRGGVSVRAVVRPLADQADVVRLTTVLPVR